MIKRISKSFSYLFMIQALSFGIVYSQTSDPASAKEIIQKQLKMLTALDDSIFDNKKDLINGKVYYTGGNDFVHPFYADNSWKPAIVYTPGAVYETELVKYDIYLDYMVLMHNSDSLSYPVYLNRESVKEFIIYGHRFQYLEDPSGSADEFVPGYYEVAYNGKTRFLIRRVKLKTFDSSSLSETYSERVYFYINKADKYLKVVRQNNLFNILNDHRKEIKAFMKNNNIRFSRNNYDQAGKVLEYYDTL